MASPEGVQLTCKFCLNENIKECIQCGSRFCALHAAKFSPNFCKECLTNLAVIIDTVTRTSTDYDMLDGELVLKAVQANRLRLDGPDWVFYNTWITNLSEEDWLQIYQFHYYVLKRMEAENEIRKVKRARRIANAPLSTRVTKEVRIKKETKPVDLQESFEKMGLSIDKIKAMLAAVGQTYRERSSGNNGTS